VDGRACEPRLSQNNPTIPMTKASVAIDGFI
jgi:hypothetical protein